MSGSSIFREARLVEYVYRLARALHVVCLACELLHEVWRGGDVLDKGTVAGNLLLEDSYLMLYLPTIAIGAYHVGYGAYRDNNGADGDEYSHRHPEVVDKLYLALFRCVVLGHSRLGYMHKLMSLYRDVPLGVLLYPLHNGAYDALVDTPFGLNVE